MPTATCIYTVQDVGTTKHHVVDRPGHQSVIF